MVEKVQIQKNFVFSNFLSIFLLYLIAAIDLKAINTSTNAVSFEPYQYYMCTV